MDVIFFHGLESGPFGSKCRALEAAGFRVYAPDYRGLSLARRVEHAVDAIVRLRPRVIVGSSYGGATAARAVVRVGAAMASPTRVVLCAPAVYLDEEPTGPLIWPRQVEAVTIHGRLDDIVPFEWSERLAREAGARLVAVDDGHRLGESIEVIVSEVAGAFGAESFAGSRVGE